MTRGVSSWFQVPGEISSGSRRRDRKSLPGTPPLTWTGVLARICPGYGPVQASWERVQGLGRGLFVWDCAGVLPTGSTLSKIGFPSRVNFARILEPCGLARGIGRPARASPMPVSSLCSPTGARSRGSWSAPGGGRPLGLGDCGPPGPSSSPPGAGRRCLDLRTALWGLIPHQLCNLGQAFLLEGVSQILRSDAAARSRAV